MRDGGRAADGADGPTRRARGGGTGERNRALTSVLQYVLVVFMVALLTSGLVYGFGEVVMDQREQAVRSNLEVVGHRIASGFGTADRLAFDDEATVAVDIDLPTDVAGVRYDVAIRTDGATSTVVLQTHHPEVTVRVTFRTETPVRESSLDGGPVTVRYDSADDVLEVVADDS